ncbi:MAG: RsmB/NOP family class I SAM-dependent RNA methyltransferase [Defluviitaleaceae bacterium]|nr:RsmB/NOP family class I SAM-dependent RNA methyltransferase [Defluviitaleaceae bacterium]
MKPPEKFTERMRETLGGEYEAFEKSFDGQPLCGLRSNRLKISAAKLKTLLPFETEAVPWCADGMYYPAGSKPGKLPLYHAGLYYIQEPSAMLPAQLLDPKPGETVLDLCAAPGGKAAQLAGIMENRGALYCNDISASRCGALVKNLELSGVACAVVLNEKPEKLMNRLPLFFDKILVDAPCSGEGMFRRDPDAAKAWTEHKPRSCVAVQRSLLHCAAAMLKPGGRLVYSTCTFNREENEDMIENFLRSDGNFNSVETDAYLLGISPAFNGLRGAVRIWPHLSKGEGHFACLIEKKRSGADSGAAAAVKNEKPNRAALSAFKEFCEKNLSLRVFQNESRLFLRGQSLYLVPEAGLPDLSGIRVSRSGLYLGETANGRFKPSQAMAMCVPAADANHILDLNAGDERVLRYLKGESFDADGSGWTLVCVSGFPLGWGRSADGRLKNNLHKGWLYQ